MFVENQPGLCFVQLENTVRLIFELAWNPIRIPYGII